MRPGRGDSNHLLLCQLLQGVNLLLQAQRGTASRKVTLTGTSGLRNSDGALGHSVQKDTKTEETARTRCREPCDKLNADLRVNTEPGTPAPAGERFRRAADQAVSVCRPGREGIVVRADRRGCLAIVAHVVMRTRSCPRRPGVVGLGGEYGDGGGPAFARFASLHSMIAAERAAVSVRCEPPGVFTCRHRGNCRL